MLFNFLPKTAAVVQWVYKSVRLASRGLAVRIPAATDLIRKNR